MAAMSGNDEQLEVLRAIWSEMKALNGRVDGVRLDLQAVQTELKAEDDARPSEVRVATALTELRVETRALASLIRECRVDRIEKHLGLP